MGENFNQIPENIREHINKLIQDGNDADQESFREAIAAGWLEKLAYFARETEAVEMEQVEKYNQDNNNGALIMTYSGSLINIGPLGGSGRKVGYTSIGLRTDVPEKLDQEDCRLAADAGIDESITFTTGPLKKSSPVYAIAVMKDGIAFGDQEEKLAEATQVLTDNFLEVNKTIIVDPSSAEALSVV